MTAGMDARKPSTRLRGAGVASFVHEADRGSPVPLLRGPHGAMPEDAVGERLVAGAARCGERIGDGCVTGLWVTVREQGEREHPEREIPPGLALRLELDRAPCVRRACHPRPGGPWSPAASPGSTRTRRCHPAGGRRRSLARRCRRSAGSAEASPVPMDSQAARTASHGRSSSSGSLKRASHDCVRARRPDQWLSSIILPTNEAARSRSPAENAWAPRGPAHPPPRTRPPRVGAGRPRGPARARRSSAARNSRSRW